MELKTLYQELRGNFSKAVYRMDGDEQMLRTVVLLFLKDDSLVQIKKTMEREDWTGAFDAVHRLKGVVINLGFDDLYQASSDLCESLRPGRPGEDTMRLYQKLARVYGKTMEALLRYASAESELGILSEDSAGYPRVRSR